MGIIKVQRNIARIMGMYVDESTLNSDSRGYFMQTYSYCDMGNAKINIAFVQDN